MKINRKLFEKSIIAQHDDQDYSESGYVACVIDDRAYLFRYSHCSCYGTWEALSNFDDCYYDDETPEDREISAVWEGSIKDLVYLAATKADPAMPERESNPDDYDHDHLMEVYKQVLEYYKAKEKVMNTQITENNQKQTWKLTEKEVYCIYTALKNLDTNIYYKEEFKDVDALQERMRQGCKSYIENKKSQMPK